MHLRSYFALFQSYDDALVKIPTFARRLVHLDTLIWHSKEAGSGAFSNAISIVSLEK